MLCYHVCHAHARPCLSTGWPLNRRFDMNFGTAALLAQGGGISLRGRICAYGLPKTTT